MEWFYATYSHDKQGTCFLNDKRPTVGGSYPGQHSCMRYDGPCPSRPVVPVVPIYKHCECKKFCQGQATDMFLVSSHGRSNNNNNNNNNTNINVNDQSKIKKN